MRLSSRIIRRNSILQAMSLSTLPVEPVSFNQGVVIDKDGNKVTTGFTIDRSNDGPLILETKNSTDMDKRITFNSDTHEYYFDGELLKHTCTGLVSSFFSRFDEDSVITKMITGILCSLFPLK